MKNPLNLVAAIGLALGAVFGMAGTFVSAANLRATFWGIDGTGLVVATAILAFKFFRRGSDLLATGFLVFAIGEGVLLTGVALPLDAMVPTFCAGSDNLENRIRRSGFFEDHCVVSFVPL